MTKPHRTAAGGIILKGDAVALVRYRDNEGGTYLVGPGGGFEGDENAFDAIVREAREETGLTVRPRKLLLVETVSAIRFVMTKLWVLCDVVEGEISRTNGAINEGIIEAGWYTREQLTKEVVHPAELLVNSWDSFIDDSWQVPCLPTRYANF